MYVCWVRLVHAPKKNVQEILLLSLAKARYPSQREWRRTEGTSSDTILALLETRYSRSRQGTRIHSTNNGKSERNFVKSKTDLQGQIKWNHPSYILRGIKCRRI